MIVSELQINDKSMMLIVRSLTFEAHNFALSRGITSHSIQDQLPFVLGIINGHAGDLLDIRDVPTRDATCLAAIRISFSDGGYRLRARAAQDGVANAVN